MSDSKNQHPKMTPAKQMFMEQFGHLDNDQLLLEILWSTRFNANTNEKNRKNTSNLVTWLVVVPIVTGILIAIFTLS